MDVARRFGGFLVLLVFGISLVGTVSAAGIDITDVQNPSTAQPTDQVRVKVSVKNELGEAADEVEVRVKGWNRLKKEIVRNMEPGEEDTLEFYLYVPEDASGTEKIEIEVQALDEDGVILADTSAVASVTVTEDEIIVHEPGGDREVDILSVAVPATIRSGQRIGIDVTAENLGGSDTAADFRVEVFGQTLEKNGVTIDKGSNATVTLPVYVPSDASGPYTADILVETFSSTDYANVTLEVQELYLTMQLSAEEVEVGEPVTVSGTSNLRDVTAKLYVGGSYETTLSTDRTGQYTYTLNPERTGSMRVELRSGRTSVSEVLNVRPKMDIEAVSAPGKVSTADMAEFCARIYRSNPGDVTVSLLSRGKVLARDTVPVDGEAEACLYTSFNTTGSRELTVEASTGEALDTRTFQVDVVKPGIDVEVFPTSLTLTSGQAGVIQVRIRNDEVKERSFSVDIKGLENVSVSGKSVELGPGESDTAVLRLVPSEIGDSKGRVVVSTSAGKLVSKRVEVVSTRNPALKNPAVRAVKDAFSSAARRFNRMDSVQRYALLVIVLAALVTGLWFLRRRGKEVMEPQY